ncbi:Centromere protein W [Labeo rohita]|uniref:Centromere protein W n=1 Tax=Labeo rohita TaxID=84645 RepID=A0ABQ8LXM1_LABRO|nr:Centromere protein W [Labeo rohita]
MSKKAPRAALKLHMKKNTNIRIGKNADLMISPQITDPLLPPNGNDSSLVLRISGKVTFGQITGHCTLRRRRVSLMLLRPVFTALLCPRRDGLRCNQFSSVVMFWQSIWHRGSLHGLLSFLFEKYSQDQLLEKYSDAPEMTHNYENEAQLNLLVVLHRLAEESRVKAFEEKSGTIKVHHVRAVAKVSSATIIKIIRRPLK